MAMAIEHAGQAETERRENVILNRISGLPFDMFIFIVFIILCNFHIISGNITRSLIFLPGSVRQGEWWRLFTHPFFHVSLYHLVLDAGAFFLLYSGLAEKRMIKKVFCVIFSGVCSLIASQIFSADIQTQGLCGLSGIAHGLMAYSSLEMIHQQALRKIGIISLIIVALKTVFEMISGNALFSSLHFGDYGNPLVTCHAGGVIGGIGAYLIMFINHPGRLNDSKR
ncbi:MAG: rhombosortase [Desulfobacterales bacterium]|nr:rhombosortase [Desulfobacterales bacterium]